MSLETFDPSELSMLDVGGVQWECGCRTSAAYQRCLHHKKSKRFLPIRYRYRGVLINIPDDYTEWDKVAKLNRRLWKVIDAELGRVKRKRRRS